jgi:hypothetical protein
MQALASLPLMMVPSMSIPHLESVFLQSTRSFLSQIDGQIEVDESFIPPVQREHDEYLMDIALTSNEFTKSELRLINYCRLYIQSVTVSDITTAQGDTLIPSSSRAVPVHLVVWLPIATPTKTFLTPRPGKPGFGCAP